MHDGVAPEVELALGDSARLRQECHAAMLRHFYEVSRVMPAEEGRRYLDWMHRQTILPSQSPLARAPCPGPMTEPCPDERDLQEMAHLASGHDAALSELMERHGLRLFHHRLRQLQNEEDAADLAQEAFVRVYQHRARFDGRQKFTTWLYAIATNLVRDRFRWRAPFSSLPRCHRSGMRHRSARKFAGEIPCARRGAAVSRAG